MGQSKYSFPKREKLTGKKRIEGLFKTGSSFYLESFRVRYQEADEESCHQILISVPKKSFKKAVDRNLIKRRIREAYRLNKELINRNERKKFFYIAFIYLSKNILTFHEIQDQLIRCLERLDNHK
ncbi:MAG: ribonuclease P protein component [Cyclobacteriaceae bacterium]